jgi:type 2 lantibiotic biosynthesis protein LanM
MSTLSLTAQDQLERSLLRTLSAACGQVLELGFSLFRFRHRPLPMLSGESRRHRDLYNSFVDEMLDGELGRLFAEYPGLESLVKVCVDQWTSAAAEFLQRLQHDQADIGSFFAGGRNPGNVVGLEADLSDRHDGGRTVMALQFAFGLRVVYKPKDLGSEEAYCAILDWFNQNGAPLDFRTLRVLRRDGYGWVEFAEHRSCKNLKEAQHYYQRAGQLLCVIYVLAGADCHFDNLIACGEHPVLVDTEMLFQPGLADRMPADSGTVLRTGLLPRPTAEARDVSGFGCVREQSTQLRIPEWREVNTDGMSLGFREAKLQPRTNVPILGGAPLSPFDYVATMGEGYRKMYRYMHANRGRLLGPDSPLARIKVVKVRILARGTVEYYLAISQMLHPRRLRVPGCLEIKFKNPARFPHAEGFELKALRRMDVPRFFLEASNRSVTTADGAEFCATFVQSGFERVVSEIENLSEARLEQQVKLIEFAWAFSALSRIS